MAMHRISDVPESLFCASLECALPNTAVAWHSRGEEDRDGLGTSVTPVEGGHSGYTRVEAPVLGDCASVLLAVNHLCYSAAILLMSQDVIRRRLE
jgi:hypothetical protein